MNMNSNIKLKYLRNVPIHTLLLVGSLFMVYPLVYSLAASLTSLAEFIRSTWIPVPLEWAFKNYREMFHPKMVPLITQSIGVTLLRTTWYIAMTSVTSVLCGYVFARLRFKGKEIAFLVLLSSMLVPAIVFQVPIFVMLARWPLAGGNNILGAGGSGFINQMPALLLGGWVSAYSIFLLRQTFYGIPSDYEEAARMDGASFLQTLRYIYLPMLTPVLMVIVISTFVANWNDYTWPLMSVGGNSKLFPVGLFFQRIMAAGLPVSTTTVTTANTITNTPLLLTAGVIASVPPVLCFFIFQRYFIEGLQGVGIKG
jgi:multiple sugar transport system permease protein